VATGDDDLRRTFKWIAHTTRRTPPAGISALAARDASYVSRRAHIADWNAVPRRSAE